MPRTIRFHRDEHCDPAIAAGLRLHGVDVTTTPEAHLLSAEDEEHVAYGVTTGRVVFTQDQDFLRLHAASVEHRRVGPVDARRVGEALIEIPEWSMGALRA